MGFSVRVRARIRQQVTSISKKSWHRRSPRTSQQKFLHADVMCAVCGVRVRVRGRAKVRVRVRVRGRAKVRARSEGQGKSQSKDEEWRSGQGVRVGSEGEE